jgi:hypothetical protein
MREVLRAVGILVHPDLIEFCAKDLKFSYEALIALLRGILSGLTDTTQDNSMICMERLNGISNASIPSVIFSEYRSILNLLQDVFGAISAPAFSATLDQDEFAALAVKSLKDLMPNTNLRAYLRYASQRSDHQIPKADQGFDRPLWADEEPNPEDPSEWRRTNEPHPVPVLQLLEGLGNDWSFWRKWYQGFLDGKPIDWRLQQLISEIDDSVWEQGAAAVAREIRRIEAKHKINKTLESMSFYTQVSVSNRHGIGGNTPPERLDDVSDITEQTTIIWASIETLKQEVASDQPNRLRVQGALNQLTRGLAACIKWMGRKGDLSVDTLIKWGIPAGCAYLLANPVKIHAVIDAVIKWVPFL